LQDKLNSAALGLPFPIVGSHLKDGAQFIAAIRTYVVQRLGQELAKISNVNEVQVITLTDADGATRSGNFRLTFQGQTTRDIDANASADDIRDALVELSNIAPGDVDVEAAPDGGFTVEFKNNLGFENVQEMTVAQQPTDGTVSISTQTQGAASII